MLETSKRLSGAKPPGKPDPKRMGGHDRFEPKMKALCSSSLVHRTDEFTRAHEHVPIPVHTKLGGCSSRRDQRRHLRKAVDRPARIILAAGDEPCRIQDVSEGGAKLTTTASQLAANLLRPRGRLQRRQARGRSCVVKASPNWCPFSARPLLTAKLAWPCPLRYSPPPGIKKDAEPGGRIQRPVRHWPLEAIL